MPRILRIINRFNLGGPTYNTAFLSKYLPTEYETLLVGGQKDDTEDNSLFIVENLGLKPIIIDEMQRPISLKNDWIAYKKLRAIIREFKPDIVHTHASKAGTLGRLAAYHENVPVIVHTFHGHVFHSYFSWAATTFYKIVERFLAKISTGIIAISERQKVELSRDHKICSPEKIQVIPLGFDLEPFNNNQTEKRNIYRHKWNLGERLTIGIIGRLVPIKNHEMFLRGILHLKQESCPALAVIVGDGELRLQLEGLCKELGLRISNKSGAEVDVLFTSWEHHVDFALAGMDLVCLTSFNEGTPVSLIEAQAAGKAILSTRVGGVENIVIEGQTALLCENNDQKTFNQLLLQLCNNKPKLLQMGSNGWEHVRNSFHYTRLCADMDKYYKKLLLEVENH